MKLSLVLALLVLVASPARAVENEDTFKAIEVAAEPGNPHKELKAMVGNWSYKSKWWATPDAKPAESQGTSTIKLVLGGRFIETHMKTSGKGQKYEGRGFSGFDNLKGLYTSVWIDDHSTSMSTSQGTYDSASRTFKEDGQVTTALNPTKTHAFRTEMKIVDKNKMIFSMYSKGLKDDQAEFLQTETVLTRTK